MARRRKTRTDEDEASRLAAIADAHTAAETAGMLATQCAEWAMRAGIGEDDAADAVRAAVRARQAADAAASGGSLDDRWESARLAWAAVSSAMEADARVTAAIVERMMMAA